MNNNFKLYAVQVNPYCQGTTINYFDYNDIFITGNKDYNNITNEIFDSCYNAINGGNDTYTLYDYIDGFSIEEQEKYTKEYFNMELSKEQIKKIWSVCEGYTNYKTENETICKLLSIVTNKTYEYNCICGNVQCEWNYIYYPIDSYSNKSIRYIESEYFNTGTEWIITTTNETNPDINELKNNGDYIYIHETLDNDIIKELSDISGINVENITLYKYHERYTPYYETYKMN